VWLAVGAGLLVTIVLGLLSEGAHHDDDLTHYLMARWAGWYPGYLLHIWGRPGCTLPLAGAAWIGDAATGWHAARVLSALATAAAALLAAEYARRTGIRRAWWVVVGCYLQPLNALLASTTLTENWTALYLMGALLLLHRGRRVAASAVFSLSLVSRHETLLLAPIWWVAVALAGAGGFRRLLSGGVVLWAPVVHNIAFRLVFDEWPAMIYFQPRGSSEYPPAGWLAYLPQALMAVPPVLAGLAILGSRFSVRRGDWLVPVMAGAYFLIHVALRAMGLFASGGYARFMVAVAPLIGILAVRGLEGVLAGRARRDAWVTLAAVWATGWVAVEVEAAAGRVELASVFAQAGRAVLAMMIFASLAMLLTTGPRWFAAVRGASTLFLCLVTAAQVGVLVHPLRPHADAVAMRRVADWLRERDLEDHPMFMTQPWLVHYLGLVENPRARKGPRLLATMPVGTVFTWDSTYSPSDFHRLPLASFEATPSYHKLQSFSWKAGTRRRQCVVFQKVAPTLVPREWEESYPPDLSARRQPVEGVYYLRPER
jgi:hypothetical protein